MDIYEKYEEALEQIEELEQDLKILRALERAGVDNWDGYEYAQSLVEG